MYKALDKNLGRSVAIKILIQDDDGEVSKEALDRFRQEMRIIANLTHACTVKVYESGQAELEGLTYHYMVMEYIEGMTLYEHLLAYGPLSRLDCVLALKQIAQSLHEAHTLPGVRLVHRDLKPANIMVVGASHGPIEVKVLDYGIAKALEANSDWDMAKTQDGDIMMSPANSAPEQISGKEIGPWTDIYALGVLAYECLVGRNPYAGQGLSFENILLKVATEPVVLPPGCAGPLEPIVEKMLRKDSERRYQSCLHLLQDLDQLERHSVLSKGDIELQNTAKVDQSALQDPTARLEDAGGLLARQVVKTERSTQDLSWEAARVASGEFSDTRAVRPGHFDPLDDKLTVPLDAIDSGAHAPPRETAVSPASVTSSSLESDWLEEDLVEVDTQRQRAMEPGPTSSKSQGALVALVLAILVCVGILVALLATNPESADATRASLTNEPPKSSLEDPALDARLAHARASDEIDRALDEARSVKPEVTRKSLDVVEAVVKTKPSSSSRGKPSEKKPKKRTPAPVAEKRVAIEKEPEAKPELKPEPVKEPVVAEKKPEPAKEVVPTPVASEPEKKPEPAKKKRKRPTAVY